MKKSELIAKYRRKGFVKQKEYYTYMEYAYEFIEDCHKSGLLILGIEGFIWEDKLFSPQMDMILDCSSIVKESDWPIAEVECYEEAKAFLNSIEFQPNLVFDFVITTKRELESLHRVASLIPISQKSFYEKIKNFLLLELISI